MQYKNFDDHITRKHGIVIEGWPLKTFENPSSVGSQLELKVLLNSWKSGATHFRKMSTTEHMAWVESRAEPSPSPSVDEQGTPPPPPQQAFNFTFVTNTPGVGEALSIQSEQPAAQTSITTTPDTAPATKKPRKVRSDKGKPRKKASQIPGITTFSARMG